MFFFQDNIGYLIRLSQSSFWGWILTYEAEHFLPIANALFFLEYKLFGMSFYPYLIISVILHLVNCLLIFKLARYLTKNSLFSYLAVLLFSINLTYTEPILWNLQGLLLSTGFLGLAFFNWLRYFEKGKNRFLVLSGMFLAFSYLSYGLGTGAGFLFAFQSFIRPRFYPKTSGKIWKKAVILYLVLGIMSILAGPFISSGIIRHITPQVTGLFETLIKLVAFAAAGVSRGVIGRFLFPGLEPTHLEVFSTMVSFVPVSVLMILFIRLLKKKSEKTDKFIILSLAVFITLPYFLAGTVRYQFGLKQALAERYAYPSLFFFILFFLLILQNLIDIKEYKKSLLVGYAFILVILQAIFFVRNAYEFEIKPVRTKEYTEQIKQMAAERIPVLDLPLPSFINQNYRISQIWPLISDGRTVNLITTGGDFCSNEFKHSLDKRWILEFYTRQAIDPAVQPEFNLAKLRDCLFQTDKSI